MTHICVSKLTIIGSDNGLSPGRRQAIIWTNAGILLIWPLGTNYSEMSIDIQTFSFKKIHFKMSSGKWRPFCLGLNVLMRHSWFEPITAHCGLGMPTVHSTRQGESNYLGLLPEYTQSLWVPGHAPPYFIASIKPKLLHLQHGPLGWRAPPGCKPGHSGWS